MFLIILNNNNTHLFCQLFVCDLNLQLFDAFLGRLTMTLTRKGVAMATTTTKLSSVGLERLKAIHGNFSGVQ